MTEVLMYNIDDSKRLKIKLLCNKLNIRAREVEKSEFGLKISTLLGLDDDKLYLLRALQGALRGAQGA